MDSLPAPTIGASVAKATLIGLSPRLQRLLENERDADAAVEDIVADPDLHAELARRLPDILARAAPGGINAVREVIGTRFAVYPQPDRSDYEWAAWWRDYYDTLEHVPREALEGGMKAWLKSPDSQFMPKPGELLAASIKAGGTLFRAASRASRAARRGPKRCGPLDLGQPLSAEERRAIAAEIVASVRAGRRG